MKKITYIVVALLVIGGTALALTNTDLLKGTFNFNPRLSNPQQVTSGQTSSEDSSNTTRGSLADAIADVEDGSSNEEESNSGSPNRILDSNTSSPVVNQNGNDEEEEENNSGSPNRVLDNNTSSPVVNQNNNTEDDEEEGNSPSPSRILDNSVSSPIANQNNSTEDDSIGTGTLDTGDRQNLPLPNASDLNQDLSGALGNDNPIDLYIDEILYNRNTNLLVAKICIDETGSSNNPTMNLSYEIKSGVNTVTSGDDYEITNIQTLSNTCRAYSVTSLPDNMPEGDFTASMTVDATNVITESDEENNSISQEFNYEQPEETAYACTSVDLQPDSYELAYNESTQSWEDSLTLSVAFTSDEITISRIMQFLMAFSMQDRWEGTLALETTGQGQFLYNGEVVTELDVYGNFTLENITYQGAAEGDTITAYMLGEGSDCMDTLTLTAEAASLSNTNQNSNTQTSTTNTQSSTTSTQTGTTSTSTTAQTESGACGGLFLDMQGREYEDTICEAYQLGIVTGATYFRPTDTLQRAEWWKLLVEASGDNPREGTSEFLDMTDPSDWFHGYVVTLEDKDVLRVRDGAPYLNPNLPMTRGWMALQMARYTGGTYYGDSNYPDVSMSDPFGYAVNYLSNLGIITGYDNGKFGPYDYITREHAIILIMRYLDALQDGTL